MAANVADSINKEFTRFIPFAVVGLDMASRMPFGATHHALKSCGKDSPQIGTENLFRWLDRLKGTKNFVLNMVKKDQLCAIALTKRR